MKIQPLADVPESKVKIALYRENAIQEILDGKVDFRNFLLRKKIWSDIIDQVFKDKRVSDYLQEEFNKYGAKVVTYKEAEIRLTSRRGEWMYDKTGDVVLTRLEEAAKPLNDKIEERKKFLQSLKGKITVLDEETGEAVDIYPPYNKPGSTSFSVTLP